MNEQYSNLTIEQKILALEYLVPDFERVIDGENIIWLDGRPQPSENEVVNVIKEAELVEAKRIRLLAAIDECADLMNKGMEWTFNGTNEVIQTRPEDKTNLLGIAIEARTLHAANVTTPFTPFRVESNVEYLITPQEGMAITSAALAHIIEKYRRIWKYKDDIRNASTIEELNNVEFYEGPLPDSLEV